MHCINQLRFVHRKLFVLKNVQHFDDFCFPSQNALRDVMVWSVCRGASARMVRRVTHSTESAVVQLVGLDKFVTDVCNVLFSLQ